MQNFYFKRIITTAVILIMWKKMISNEQKLVCCIGLVSLVLVLSLPEIYTGIDFQKAYSLIPPRQIGPQSILLLNNTGVVNNTGVFNNTR
jgi:hypothetical protein